MNKIKIFSLVLFSACALNLAACENTWHGAGQDIENAGESMQDDFRE